MAGVVVEVLASSSDVDADEEVSAEESAMSGAPKITVCDTSPPAAVVEVSSVACVCETSSSAWAAGMSQEKICGCGIKDDGESFESSVGAAGGGGAAGGEVASPEDEPSVGADAGGGVAGGGEVASGVVAVPPEDESPDPESEVVVAAGETGTSAGAEDDVVTACVVVPISVGDETTDEDVSSIKEFSAEEVGVSAPEVEPSEFIGDVPFISSDEVVTVAALAPPELLVVVATASPICHMNVRPTFVMSLDVRNVVA